MVARMRAHAVLALALALATASCGGETDTSISTGDPSTNRSGGAPPDAAGSSAGGGGSNVGGSGAGGIGAFDASTGLDLTPEDAACRSGGEPSDCISCCDANHPDAYLVQAERTRACACASPGYCANICSTSYCVNQPVTGGNCYGCVFPLLAPGAACFPAALDACGTDAACAAYVKCRANCVR